MQKALYELSDTALAPINARVVEFQKEFHVYMKANGYVRKTSTQSALYTWDYIKGVHRITINGWHGTGKRGTSRFYGASKTLNGLYDSRNPPSYKSVIDIPDTGNSYEELIAAMDKGMRDALAYIHRTVK